MHKSQVPWETNAAIVCASKSIRDQISMLCAVVEKSPIKAARLVAARQLIQLATEMVGKIENVEVGNPEIAHSVAATLSEWPIVIKHQSSLGRMVEAKVKELALGSLAPVPYRISTGEKYIKGLKRKDGGRARAFAKASIVILHQAKMLRGHQRNLSETKKRIAGKETKTVKDKLRSRLPLYENVAIAIETDLDKQITNLCQMLRQESYSTDAQIKNAVLARVDRLEVFTARTSSSWIAELGPLLDECSGRSLEKSERLVSDLVRSVARQKKGGLRSYILRQIEERMKKLAPQHSAQHFERMQRLYDPLSRPFAPSDYAAW